MRRRSPSIWSGNPAVLEDILDGLFEIAKADGVLHPGEAAFLERVADIFGFAPGEYRRIRASHFAPDAGDPYVVLGVGYDAGDDEIKRTYLPPGAREPSRQPDRARRAGGVRPARHRQARRDQRGAMRRSKRNAAGTG